jgi:hypothetical protein
MTGNKIQSKDHSPVFNRVLYVGFVIMSFYFLVRGDVLTAGSNLGIALIFDPVYGVKWEDRKLWQKSCLMVHLITVLFLLGYGFFIK